MLVAVGVLALAQAACVVAFAWIVTQLVVRAIAGEGIGRLGGLIGALVVVVVIRGLVMWLSDLAAARGGARVIAQLRDASLRALGRLGPGWVGSRSTAEVTLTAGRGLDALGPYFTRYVPQLVLTAVATPVLVIVILTQDVTSGIIVIITLPLIPVFMVLVGWATQAAQLRQWETLGRLSRGFLDTVNGLATLKLFGRQYRQAERIRAVSDDYRVRTMKVLRISFLSGFVLELGASLSVALVAVEIGLRLLGGDLGLSVGLFVLLLAPEVFLPIRNVGSSYHAATQGIQAAASVFEILDDDRRHAGDTGGAVPRVAVEVADGALRFDDVAIAYDGREVVSGLTVEFAPGTFTVVTGRSGSGKSSAIAAVLGFVPFDGAIRLGSRTAGGSETVRERVAWAGQRPGLVQGTILSNVALGEAEPDAELGVRALAAAAASELQPDAPVGVAGSGLSGGQAQRVAVARAIYRMLSRDCPVLILDEPTSALDDTTEARLVRSLREFAADGRTVVVVSHRAAVIDAADSLVTVGEAVHV